MLKTMRPGAVIVDIAIDQGGCCETSKPTTHSHPTYVVDGIVHYCVANMPGAVARTSTFALNHATLPFALALADKGWREALKDDPHLRAGLNVHDGKVTCEPVAAAHGLPYTPAESVLEDETRGRGSQRLSVRPRATKSKAAATKAKAGATKTKPSATKSKFSATKSKQLSSIFQWVRSDLRRFRSLRPASAISTA